MPKKIRLIDEETPEELLDTVDFQNAVLELAKTMDWKLWEMLQTVQRLEKRLNSIVAEDIDDVAPTKRRVR